MENFGQLLEEFRPAVQDSQKLIDKFEQLNAHQINQILSEDPLVNVNTIEGSLQDRIKNFADTHKLSSEQQNSALAEIQEYFNKLKSLRIEKNDVQNKRTSTVGNLKNQIDKLNTLIEEYKRAESASAAKIDASLKIKQEMIELEDHILYIQRIDSFVEEMIEDFEIFNNNTLLKLGAELNKSMEFQNRILNMIREAGEDIRRIIEV